MLFDPLPSFYPDCCEDAAGDGFVRQALDLCVVVCVIQGSCCSVLTVTNIIMDTLPKSQFKEKPCPSLICQDQATKIRFFLFVLLLTPSSTNLRHLFNPEFNS